MRIKPEGTPIAFLYLDGRLDASPPSAVADRVTDPRGPSARPGLGAAVRRLKPPLVRQLVAFTRHDWSTLAAAFLEVLQAQAWDRRPASATVVE